MYRIFCSFASPHNKQVAREMMNQIYARHKDTFIAKDIKCLLCVCVPLCMQCVCLCASACVCVRVCVCMCL